MPLYPSCLSNRIDEAQRYLKSIRMVSSRFSGYPYHIVDLSVRMRPIVEVIEDVRSKTSDVALVTFEPSRSYPRNNKYMERHTVELMVVLGAIIHERYIHMSAQQGHERTILLDVQSDRGRWIVNHDEFIDRLKSYLLSRNEIAIIVCDMIDTYGELVANNEVKYRTIPPTIGNYDLDWLLSEHAGQNEPLKRDIMAEIFNVSKVPESVVTELRFSANSIGYQMFDLHFSPHHWRGNNAEHVRKISWASLSDIVRKHLVTAA